MIAEHALPLADPITRAWKLGQEMREEARRLLFVGRPVPIRIGCLFANGETHVTEQPKGYGKAEWQAVFRLAAREFNLSAVVLVSDIWMSELAGELRIAPSEAPDRQDALQVCVIPQIGALQLRVYPYTRRGRAIVWGKACEVLDGGAGGYVESAFDPWPENRRPRPTAVEKTP